MVDHVGDNGDHDVSSGDGCGCASSGGVNGSSVGVGELPLCRG